MSTEAESRCLGVFAIVLAQSLDGGPGGGTRGWLTTLNLQLASMELCRACRSAPRLTVRVDVGTPRHLWSPSDDPHVAPQERKTGCGVPALRPLGVRWMLPGVFIPAQSRPAVDQLIARLGSMSLRLRFEVPKIAEMGNEGASAAPSNPPSVYFLQFKDHQLTNSPRLVPGRYLTFDDTRLNQPAVGVACPVVWPASLRQFRFGDFFNDSTSGMAWPTSLRRISFGNYSNQPISGTPWPASLEELTFGAMFDQPIAEVVLPAGLQRLEFGLSFNRPVAGVVWPASLQRLSFGRLFNQPVAGAKWPAPLQQLSFGDQFNQSIIGVEWPGSLLQLSFGNHFNQSIIGVEWPESLQRLSFGDRFDRPIDGVVWPAGLRQLAFGERFNRPIAAVKWPASLQHLRFGREFGQPVSDVAWPASLRTITVGSAVTKVGE